MNTGRDPALTGIPGQRVDQVSEDPYTDEKSLASYLDRAAFAYPAAGTLGNHRSRSIEGPGYWSVDTSLVRLLSLGASRTLEFRVEAFNLLNNFNWGDPVTNLDAATFGRITTQTGSSRIMQFAIKYGF